MESDKPTIEEQITTVLIDIEQKGFSAIQPFCIGDIEQRMMQFAQNRTDKKEFNGKRYMKIESDRHSDE